MLLRPDRVVISQGSENSKVPSHEISRCARVQLSIWQPGVGWGRGGSNNGSVSNRRPARESTPSFPGTDGGGGIKLTDQKRSREHFGVVGTFPAAVLERRSQPKDVILRRGRGSEVKQGATHRSWLTVRLLGIVSNYGNDHNHRRC